MNSAENSENLTQNIPSNPVTTPTDSVLNTENVENVENSGNLLNMTEQVPPSIPQMNETPKSGFAAPQTGFGEAIAPAAQVAPVAPVEQGASIIPGAVGSQSEPSAAFAAESLGQPSINDTPTEPPVSGAASQFAQVAPAAQVASEAAKKHTAEHKYTLGHLIMCLASTAIMAIVAGVFAGLYFSVV